MLVVAVLDRLPVMKQRIQILNTISSVGWSCLPEQDFELAEDMADPQAIMLRIR